MTAVELSTADARYLRAHLSAQLAVMYLVWQDTDWPAGARAEAETIDRIIGALLDALRDA